MCVLLRRCMGMGIYRTPRARPILPGWEWAPNVDEKWVATEDDDECPICLEPMRRSDSRVHSLPCFHSFHVDCIHSWFERKHTCPMCLSTAHDW
jgi:hypothetical protein